MGWAVVCPAPPPGIRTQRPMTVSHQERQFESIVLAGEALVTRLRSLLEKDEVPADRSESARRALRQLELSVQMLGNDDPDDLPSVHGGLSGLVSNVTTRLMEEDADEGEHPAAPLPDRAPRAHVTGDAGFSGACATVPLPELLGFLQVHGHTGELVVEAEQETFTIHFHGGDLIDATSDNAPPEMRLGEILISMGAIDGVVLLRLLESPDAGDRLGDALERRRLVDRDTLLVALRYQVQQLFHRLFRAENARFSFSPLLPQEVVSDYRLNVTQLLLESARQHDESRPS